MDLVTQSEAARILGIGRQNVQHWIKQPPKERPKFLTKSKDPDDDKWYIDIDHKEWKKLEKENFETGKIVSADRRTKAARAKVTKTKSKSSNAKKKPSTKKDNDDDEIENTETTLDPDLLALKNEAKIAVLKQKIYASQVAKEKAKQAQLETLQIEKDLVQFALIEYFFSFLETLAFSLYSRHSEIAPQLEAFYLAKEPKKAVAFSVRETETIINSVRADLIAEMEKESLSFKQKIKKQKG